MCRTYNTIGSLTTLKSHLLNNNIRDFKSLKEVMVFQKSYTTLRQQLVTHHQNLIEQEKCDLFKDLQELETLIQAQSQQTEQRLKDEITELHQRLSISIDEVPTNIIQRLTKSLKHWSFRRNIKRKEANFDKEVKMSISILVDKYQVKNDRYQFIVSKFDEAIGQSAEHSLFELDRKKEVIDNLNSFICGALGEQTVVKTLEALSDEYFLINDFAINFSQPVYYTQEHELIRSVQIDHILVGPSGIFLIETKNWSENSLKNMSLRSPVQQMKRSSFVLFKLLNNEMNNYTLRLDRHHWGERKIVVRNLIVLTNSKPKEEFQYVKVLTVKELLGYINYFKQSFSNTDIQSITDYLVDINNQKMIINN